MASPFTAYLDKILTWAKSQDYKGYSKFDVFNSPILKKLSFNIPHLRIVMSPLWARSPVNLRPLFQTEKKKNPKGIGLFATALLRKYQVFKKKEDLVEAEKLLTWLDDNPSRGYSGKCWGYDHDWQNLHFYAPQYTPNIVVTGNIAYAFLEAYETTGQKKYLEVARSAVEFMLRDLETPFSNRNMRSISYIPGNNWAVLNINGLAAAIMIRVWQHTKEENLRSQAKKLTAFLVDKQTDYGAWHYAWPAKTSNVKHDNYHTGNVLDWLLDYTIRSGDETFKDQLTMGLEFYRDNLFLSNGAPKWRSDRTNPLDIHGAAQAIVTFSKTAEEVDPSFLKNAQQTANWAVNTLWNPDGCFYYQKGKTLTKKYTLMRWCNAWMALALSSLIRAEKKCLNKDSH